MKERIDGDGGATQAALDRFFATLAAHQVQLPEEAARLLRENLWQLYDEADPSACAVPLEGDDHEAVAQEVDPAPTTLTEAAARSGVASVDSAATGRGGRLNPHQGRGSVEADPVACAVPSEPQEKLSRSEIWDRYEMAVFGKIGNTFEVRQAARLNAFFDWLASARAVVPPEGLRAAVKLAEKWRERANDIVRIYGDKAMGVRADQWRRAARELEAALSAVDPPRETPVWDKAEFVRRFAAALDEAWPDPPAVIAPSSEPDEKL